MGKIKDKMELKEWKKILSEYSPNESLYSIYIYTVWKMDSNVNNYLSRKFKSKLMFEDLKLYNGIHLFEEYKFEMGPSRSYDLDATIFSNLIYLENHEQFKSKNNKELEINDKYFNKMNENTELCRDLYGQNFIITIKNEKCKLRGETLTSGLYYYNKGMKFFNFEETITFNNKFNKMFEEYMFNIGRKENYFLQVVPLLADDTVDSKNNINTNRNAKDGKDRADFLLWDIYNKFLKINELGNGEDFPEYLNNKINELWLNQFENFETFVDYHNLNCFVNETNEGYVPKILFGVDGKLEVPKDKNDLMTYFKNFNDCFTAE